MKTVVTKNLSTAVTLDTQVAFGYNGNCIVEQVINKRPQA